MAILGNIGKPGAGIISHINNTGGISNLIHADDIRKHDRKRSSSALYKDMEEGYVKMLLISGNPCVTWPDSARWGFLPSISGVYGFAFILFP